MPAPRGRTTRWILAGFASALALAGGCTVFNGLEVPQGTNDGGQDVFNVPEVANDTPQPPPDQGGGDSCSAAPPTYLTIEDAARVCALVFKCNQLSSSIASSTTVPTDPTNFSNCMDWLAGPISPTRVGFALQQQVFQCLTTQTTCQGAGSCLSLEDIDSTDPRCAGVNLDASVDGGGQICGDDGGSVFKCNFLYILHCNAAYYERGSHCLWGSENAYWCAIDTACPAGTCQSSLLDYCAGDNLHEGVNCPVAGYTCGIDPEAGYANCLTGTSSIGCNSAGATICNGDKVQVCDGVNAAQFDCTSFCGGGKCDTTNGPARCVRPSDTCTPFDPAENQCSGTTLSICVGGHQTSVDCAAVGLQCISGHCG